MLFLHYVFARLFNFVLSCYAFFGFVLCLVVCVSGFPILDCSLVSSTFILYAILHSVAFTVVLDIQLSRHHG